MNHTRFSLATDANELKFKSLGDRAADIIRSRIVHGEYPMGSRLTEEMFTDDLGLSRGCVREAFLALEAEGLVCRGVRNKYTEVVSFDVQKVEEVYSVRAALEVLAAETCVKKKTVPVEELRRKIDTILQINRSGQHDVLHYVEADFKFHETIVRASGNRCAAGIWTDLKSQMMVLMYACVNKGPGLVISGDVGRHGEIVDALERGDAESGCSLLRYHIMGNVEFLIEHIGDELQ